MLSMVKLLDSWILASESLREAIPELWALASPGVEV